MTTRRRTTTTNKQEAAWEKVMQRDMREIRRRLGVAAARIAVQLIEQMTNMRSFMN